MSFIKSLIAKAKTNICTHLPPPLQSNNSKNIRRIAFSIAEAMITLLIISIIMAASAPIVSHKLKSSSFDYARLKQEIIGELNGEIGIPAGTIMLWGRQNQNCPQGWSQVRDINENDSTTCRSECNAMDPTAYCKIKLNFSTITDKVKSCVTEWRKSCITTCQTTNANYLRITTKTAEIGKTWAPALPNIYGKFTGTGHRNSIVSVGAFRVSSLYGVKVKNDGEEDAIFKFDASGGNPIYRNDLKIQPQSVSYMLCQKD